MPLFHHKRRHVGCTRVAVPKNEGFRLPPCCVSDHTLQRFSYEILRGFYERITLRVEES
jgi:hypothetical protein